AGGPPGGPSTTEATAVWRGLAARPWSPAHLRREAAADGAVLLHWIRRARLGGDGWEVEPPLSEEAQRYRLEILDGEAVVRTVETTEPRFVWSSAMQVSDFAGGIPDPLSVRVAQRSAVFGWGAETHRLLWR
ncbi:MAG: hypothetical protein V4466_05225, partial [Pseudomonadota bacterium]